jgi:protein-S-isoprenylcysteine O-methyltransferase Ste14
VSSAVQGAYRIPWAPIIYVAAIGVALLAHAAFPLGWLEGPLADILFAIGWLLVVASVGIAVSALRALSSAKTTIAPHRPSEHLVTGGPFSFTRNPIYLSGALVMIGAGLITGIAWLIFLAVLAAFATQKVAIEPEEKHLFQRFGKKYHDYQKRVRRWV